MTSLRTPITAEALQRARQDDPLTAAVRAWTEPGPHPQYHERCRLTMREAMPLVADALDRLAADHRR